MTTTKIEPAKAIVVRKYCECGGEFITASQTTALLCFPPKYSHVCNKCGKITLFSHHYPSFEVRALDWEGDDE